MSNVIMTNWLEVLPDDALYDAGVPKWAARADTHNWITSAADLLGIAGPDTHMQPGAWTISRVGNRFIAQRPS